MIRRQTGAPPHDKAPKTAEREHRCKRYSNPRSSADRCWTTSVRQTRSRS